MRMEYNCSKPREQYCWVVGHNVVMEERLDANRKRQLHCMHADSCEKRAVVKTAFDRGKQRPAAYQTRLTVSILHLLALARFAQQKCAKRTFFLANSQRLCYNKERLNQTQFNGCEN